MPIENGDDRSDLLFLSFSSVQHENHAITGSRHARTRPRRRWASTSTASSTTGEILGKGFFIDDLFFSLLDLDLDDTHRFLSSSSFLPSLPHESPQQQVREMPQGAGGVREGVPGQELMLTVKFVSARCRFLQSCVVKRNTTLNHQKRNSHGFSPLEAEHGAAKETAG